MSFIRASDSSPASIHRAIKESISHLGLNLENKKVKSIAIKPNMCYYYHPSTGEVTDPVFVGILIDVLRELFPSSTDISIVESDASAMKCVNAYRMLGYDKLASKKQVKLVNLCEEKSSKHQLIINGKQLEFEIPKLLLDCDFIVNVPKLKYMKPVTISCAMKNIFGCNAVQKKSSYHKTLNESIVGLNRLIKSNLIVADGLVVHGQYTKRLNMVMACENVVAFDTAASHLLGMNPNSIKQLSLANKEHLGKLEYAVRGDFNFFKENFPKKEFSQKAFETIASIYLKLFHKS